MKELLLTLLVPVVELIAAGLAENYDPEAEKQALLRLQRALYDERVRKLTAP